MNEVKNIFNETLELVIECGNILKDKLNEEKDSKIKEDGSIVTKYDLLMDKILSEKLKKFGNCSVLSEEHKEDNIEDTYFVVDPIDGTHNFEIGWDIFGIMVSYVYENETQFSIIHMPLLNKTCTAIKGEGTYLNNKKVTVKSISNKLVGGCPVTKNNLESIIKILNSEQNIELRSLFCIAGEQNCVVSGIFDFAFSKNTGSIWDFVGTELMVKEAGGIMKLKKLDNGKYNVIYGSKEAVEIVENIIKIL